MQRAILAGHHINLLGLRGQAKTRIARLLINLLDEYMPVVAGSELNDDPLQPLSGICPQPDCREGRRHARVAGCTATTATPRSWPRPT
ncbi:MAG: hypothetical protein WKG07_47335 [Hymenobacter sp.]